MRISVVTPSFNMAGYLEDTIRSVVENLRPGDEYFVIDGGSSDGSVDIIRRYEKHLTGWISEPDDGYGHAIAKGFARASGDVLCWLNCSDVYLKGAFDEVRRLFRDDVDLIFGDDFYFDESGGILGFSYGRVSDLRQATLYGGWTPLQEACFWRRDLYEKVGGIDGALRFAADYDLFLRMSGAGRAAYVPYTFSAFRLHTGQKSVSGTHEYERERRRRRREELSRLHEPAAVSLAKRIVVRNMMRVRARVVPRLWQRKDLFGVPVETLRCARYGEHARPWRTVSP